MHVVIDSDEKWYKIVNIYFGLNSSRSVKVHLKSERNCAKYIKLDACGESEVNHKNNYKDLGVSSKNDNDVLFLNKKE